MHVIAGPLHILMICASTYKYKSMLGKSTQICHNRHARKTGVLFLLYDTDTDFISRNNFAKLGSFAKVFVPIQPVTPWYTRTTKMELSTIATPQL